LLERRRRKGKERGRERRLFVIAFFQRSFSFALFFATFHALEKLSREPKKRKGARGGGSFFFFFFFFEREKETREESRGAPKLHFSFSFSFSSAFSPFFGFSLCPRERALLARAVSNKRTTNPYCPPLLSSRQRRSSTSPSEPAPRVLEEEASA